MQTVYGEENVADMLTKNVKSEMLRKLLSEMGSTKATRREMGDELTGAHDEQPASQYSEDDQCRVESIGSVLQRLR